MQDKAALIFNRPPEMYRNIPGLRIGRNIQFSEQFAKVDGIKRLVDDNAHRTVFIVCAHIDHRAFKTRVAHRRHGEQDLPDKSVLRVAIRSCHLSS